MKKKEILYLFVFLATFRPSTCEVSLGHKSDELVKTNKRSARAASLPKPANNFFSGTPSNTGTRGNEPTLYHEKKWANYNYANRLALCSDYSELRRNPNYCPAQRPAAVSSGMVYGVGQSQGQVNSLGPSGSSRMLNPQMPGPAAQPLDPSNSIPPMDNSRIENSNKPAMLSNATLDKTNSRNRKAQENREFAKRFDNTQNPGLNAGKMSSFRRSQYSAIQWRNHMAHIRDHRNRIRKAAKLWNYLQLEGDRFAAQQKLIRTYDRRVLRNKKMLNFRNNREMVYESSLRFEETLYKNNKKVSSSMRKKQVVFEKKTADNLTHYYLRKGASTASD